MRNAGRADEGHVVADAGGKVVANDHDLVEVLRAWRDTLDEEEVVHKVAELPPQQRQRHVHSHNEICSAHRCWMISSDAVCYEVGSRLLVGLTFTHYSRTSDPLEKPMGIKDRRKTSRVCAYEPELAAAKQSVERDSEAGGDASRLEIRSFRVKKAKNGGRTVVIQYAAGGQYNGEADEEQQRHGYGVYLTHTGHRYQGDWVHGVFQG